MDRMTGQPLNTGMVQEQIMLTATQSRAARCLLEWSQFELGARSNLSESAVRDFEKDRRLPSLSSLVAIRYAFEDAGVEFTNGVAPG
jgi:transcriptional regulator with XRE-family HTH domain